MDRSVDKFRLYELAVTNAANLARFAQALHPNARTLREDFCGTAALARAWAELDAASRSVGVDLDRRVLAKAPKDARLTLLAQDARRARARADLIAATNFPLGYWHTRGELLAYLRAARRSLSPRGVFVADLYGGANAFRTGTTTRRVRIPSGGSFEYRWEQRNADEASRIVENAIHFKVGTKLIRDAFTYRWRLWTIPELREALIEAGFRRTEVHDRVGGAIDHLGRLHVRPLQPGEPLDEDWVVYVVGRA